VKSLLWVGDAGVPSGFAKATHEILNHLLDDFRVTVLGINYRGDPHAYPYEIWAALPGGDYFGIGRLIWMCDLLNGRDGKPPDVIVLQNDGWNIPQYMQLLRKKLPSGKWAFPEYANIPVVAIVAVDGKNFQGKWLDGVSMAIFWTQFALDEARRGGYTGEAAVIPLGVDLNIYKPVPQAEARARRLDPSMKDFFIVGNVNRNQPRKRWDLMIKYFAAWIKQVPRGTEEEIATSRVVIRDAMLLLHTAPTGDTGCDVAQLARYYGVAEFLAVAEPQAFYGISEEMLVDFVNCFDVNASTSQGEGFGLTALESMACGKPNVLGDWSAYGEWAKGAAWLVPCKTTHIGPPYTNVIGGVPDQEEFVKALNRLYTDKRTREINGLAALERAREPQFRWENIGKAYQLALASVLCEHKWIDMTTLTNRGISTSQCSLCKRIRTEKIVEEEVAQ
jgi:glycosyltransferase involved in cell wall biosynthesis